MYLDLAAIGRFIQSFRKASQMTQAELGERLNVSAQSVSNWERGESLPDIALMPDLARILHCSVDAILYAGNGCGSYRRHMTVADAREALLLIRRIGDLLGDDHPVYDTIIKAINSTMNTDIRPAFTNQAIFEVFVAEFLLHCLHSSDYVDPRDVCAHLKEQKSRAYLLDALAELGIR